ncbi:hypothetical protein AB0I02_02010 [Streptomyces phaeochromogenes]
MTSIAPTLQSFFTDRLVRQRQANPRTVPAYRDALRLLLGFVHQHTGTAPEKLDWTDLDADAVSAFLNYLEDERVNSTLLTPVASMLSTSRWRSWASGRGRRFVSALGALIVEVADIAGGLDGDLLQLAGAQVPAGGTGECCAGRAQGAVGDLVHHRPLQRGEVQAVGNGRRHVHRREFTHHLPGRDQPLQFRFAHCQQSRDPLRFRTQPFRLGPVRRRSLIQLLQYDIATHRAASPCQLITSNRHEPPPHQATDLEDTSLKRKRTPRHAPTTPSTDRPRSNMLILYRP